MSDRVARPMVLGPGEGEPLNLRGAEMRVKASAETGGGAFSVIESRDPSGFAAAPHIHHQAIEALYVLDGDYIFEGAEGETPVGPGGFVLVSKGIRHAYRLVGDRGRILIVYAPAGIERFWQELGRLVDEGRFTPDARNQLARDMLATEFL